MISKVLGQVSIIVPTYNNAHLISSAIDSVLGQTYMNWELIIIDYNSTDGTKEVVDKYCDSRIRYLLVDNNGIVANSRNVGIKNSEGEFIAFLDSDDWWTIDKLERAMNLLIKGFDLVYHDMWLITNPNSSVKKIYKSKDLKTSITKNLLVSGNHIINSSVVLRSTLVDIAGFLDENPALKASEDYEYWLRMSLHTVKFKRINKCLGYYWYAGNNISKNRDMSTAGEIILSKYRDFITSYDYKMALGYNYYSKGIYFSKMKDTRNAILCFVKSFKISSYLIKFKAAVRMLNLLLIEFLLLYKGIKQK